MNKLNEITVSLEIPIRYENINPGVDKPLLIFFHGFADSASALLRRAYPEPSDKYEILAINGPFPVPQKRGDKWKYAYAWYFTDFSTVTSYISPQVAARAVCDLLTKLNLHNRRKMLIGFSQGAFFIPHLLPYLSKVEHIVAIGAAYRPEDYPAILNVTVDALHGSNDEIISINKAYESFQTLKTKNPKGEFIEFKDMRHTMNDESRAWLSKKIEQVFK